MNIPDISRYDTVRDWDALKQYAPFVILKCGGGKNGLDSKFTEHARSCIEYGIPFGVYWYLINCANEQDAAQQAQQFRELCANYNPLFFALDFEESDLFNLDYDALGAAFMAALGNDVRRGLYVPQRFAPKMSKTRTLTDFLWIPNWSGEPTCECDLWQYTSTAYPSWAGGNTDLSKITGQGHSLEWFLRKEVDDTMAENVLTPFTAEHFAQWCESMEGAPYWYGTCIYPCTNDLLKRKSAQYPEEYESNRTARYRADIAAKRVCADCIGAYKGYMWTNGGVGVLEYIANGSPTFKTGYAINDIPDKSADGMFEFAKKSGMEWGTIDTLPELPGIAVRMGGHVGYYVGNGEVIEWKGFSWGCVRTQLAGRGWTHWYKLPGIVYGEADVPTLGSRELKTGMTGADVRELQEALILLGYSCGESGADGEFGSATQAAVKNFQLANGLVVDGIFGEKSYAALSALIADSGDADAESDYTDDETIDETETESVDETIDVGTVTVTGNSVYLWDGHPNFGGEKAEIVYKGEKMRIVTNGYVPVEHDGELRWINSKYVE